MNEHDEAQFVANQVLVDFSAGKRWKDHAVLYRMNAQSNQIENALTLSPSFSFHIIFSIFFSTP